jgi:hypothetical protein
MHGELSKKYLDKFPEDRSAKDAGILPQELLFSPKGKDSNHWSDRDCV